MRCFTILLFATFTTACNNNKIDRLESEVQEIKQSLARIEMLLSGRAPENSTKVTPQDSYGSGDKTNKPVANGRCNAITKKGTQCSRNAKSGGYCWQHGG